MSSRVVFATIITSLICHAQINQYIKQIGPNNEDIWRSTTDFIPVQSSQSGTIKLGKEMDMAFDFIWWGYTYSPRGAPHNDYENFFRIGCSAFPDLTTPFGSPCQGGVSCTGQGARYPSLWIIPELMNAGTADNPFPNLQSSGSDHVPHPLARHLHLSVSGHDGTSGSCQPSMEIDLWGEIIIGTKYHVNIWFNESIVLFSIGHYSNYTRDPSTFPELIQNFTREGPTADEFVGHDMPIWWMSDKTTDPLFNRGNGTFSNITIISRRWTTAMPTTDPTTAFPSYFPSISPTAIEKEPSPPGTDVEEQDEDETESDSEGMGINLVGIIIIGGICGICCLSCCGIRRLYRKTLRKYEEHSQTEDENYMHDEILPSTTTGLTVLPDIDTGTKSNENLTNEEQTPIGVSEEIGRGITDLQEELDDSEDKIDEHSQLNDSKYE